jgi:hypothetical protein
MKIYRIMRGKPGIFETTNDFNRTGPGLNAGEKLMVGVNGGFTLERMQGLDCWRLVLRGGEESAKILPGEAEEVVRESDIVPAQKTQETGNSPAPKPPEGESGQKEG